MSGLRRVTLMLTLLLASVPAVAQNSILLLPDRLMCSGRIAAATRKTAPVIPAALPAVSISPDTGSRPIGADYEFCKYLLDGNLASDALSLLCSGRYSPSDTLTFLRAWSLYSTRHLQQAVEQFGKVPTASSYHHKSLFYSVALDAHLGDYAGARALLDSYSGSEYAALSATQRAGIAILENDRQGYEAAAAGFGTTGYALEDSRANLQMIASQRFGKRQRSPLLGAAASALVPGLGKLYAGCAGEAVSTFLCVGSLAAITAENWVHCGPTDWKTLLFGGLGAIFYLGNIYGSYISVSLYNDYAAQTQNTAVLYNIHIPLDSIFK